MTDHQIDVLEKDCSFPDRGSKYYKPFIVKQLIERIRELEQQLDQIKNKELYSLFDELDKGE
jgi:hypothetical protein